MDNPGIVGKRIKEARNNKGFSQQELALLSKVSTNTLSLLERGLTSPTIATLQKLADSLSVDISFFFTSSKLEDEIVFSQHQRRIPTSISEGFLSDLSNGYSSELVRTFEMQINPKSKSKKNISHAGLEFIYCLDNELIYIVSDRAYLLEQGDTLLFNAHLPHHWQNSTDHPTKLLMVQIKTNQEDAPCELIKQIPES